MKRKYVYSLVDPHAYLKLYSWVWTGFRGPGVLDPTWGIMWVQENTHCSYVFFPPQQQQYCISWMLFLIDCECEYMCRPRETETLPMCYASIQDCYQYLETLITKCYPTSISKWRQSHTNLLNYVYSPKCPVGVYLGALLMYRTTWCTGRVICHFQALSVILKQFIHCTLFVLSLCTLSITARHSVLTLSYLLT